MSNSSLVQSIAVKSSKYDDIIANSARKYNVEPELIKAIIQIESNWDPNAGSNKGARGLMQLMPPTAADMGVKNMLDPAQNIDGGTKYIAQQLRRYNGDMTKALGAYNAGPGNINKGYWPEETQASVPNVLSVYRALKGDQSAQIPGQSNIPANGSSNTPNIISQDQRDPDALNNNALDMFAVLGLIEGNDTLSDLQSQTVPKTRFMKITLRESSILNPQKIMVIDTLSAFLITAKNLSLTL